MPGVVVHTLIPAQGRLVDLCKFEANLVYIKGSTPAQSCAIRPHLKMKQNKATKLRMESRHTHMYVGTDFCKLLQEHK